MKEPNTHKTLKLQESESERESRAQTLLWPALPPSLPREQSSPEVVGSFPRQGQNLPDCSWQNKLEVKKNTSEQQCILEKIKVTMISLNITPFYDIEALTNSSSTVTQIDLIICYSSLWGL